MKKIQMLFLISLCFAGLYLNYELVGLGAWLSTFDQDDKWIIACVVAFVFLAAWMIETVSRRADIDRRKSGIRVGACIRPAKPFWLGFKWQRSND